MLQSMRRNVPSPLRHWQSLFIATSATSALAIAVWSVLAAGPAQGPAQAAGSCTVSTNDILPFDAEEQNLWNQINSYRAQYGAPALSISSALTTEADWMAHDIADHNALGSYPIDSLGRDVSPRLADCAPQAASESVGYGVPFASYIFSTWQVLEPMTLTNPSYTTGGLARAYNPTSTYTWYWILTLGGSTAPIPPPPPTAPPAATATPAPSGNWTFCGYEDWWCGFAGTAQVRYGANGVYAYGTFTGGVLCSYTVFGDPLYGVYKTCEYSGTGTTAPVNAAPMLQPTSAPLVQPSPTVTPTASSFTRTWGKKLANGRRR